MWEFAPQIYQTIMPVKDFLKIHLNHWQNQTDLKMRHFEDKPVAKSLCVRLEGAAPLKAGPVPVANVVGALLKRVGTDTGINRKFLRGLKQFTANWLRKNMRPLHAGTDLSVDSWLDSTHYSKSRKDRLRKVYEDGYELEGMACRRMLGGGDMPRKLKDAVRVNSFIKDEPYPSPKYPRSINSRSDWFKVYSGPQFARIGEEIGRNECFIKYVPVADRMQTIWERLHTDGGTYFASDYTSFESHFSAALMNNCEVLLYRYMTQLLPVSERTKMSFIISTITGENSLAFKDLSVKIPATRMSGEMNTSLGNGFSNLMLMLYTYHIKDCGEVKIFVEGDDSISWVERPQNVPTVDDFRHWGFIIKLEKSQNLGELSFCGQVFDAYEGIVITNPVEALMKFGWSNKRYIDANENTIRQLTLASAYSMAYQYNGCPMLSAFARKIVSLLKGVKVSRRLVHCMDMYLKEEYLEIESCGLPSERVPGVGTRALFEKLYGISVADQLLFEDSITADLRIGDSIDVGFFRYTREELDNVDRICTEFRRRITVPPPEFLAYLESLLPRGNAYFEWPQFYKRVVKRAIGEDRS